MRPSLRGPGAGSGPRRTREIGTVLMLRPTESPVVFLQQLGRGLRTRDGKDALTVIDFIGNHR